MPAVDPRVWGPSTWRTLHYIALGYPDRPDAADAARYTAFFEGLGPLLPCAACAANYGRHLLELPIAPFLALGGAAPGGLFDWTVRLHNVVNAEKGKPMWPLGRAAEQYGGSGRPGALALFSSDEWPGTPAVLALATGIALFMLLAVWLLARWRRGGGGGGGGARARK